MFEAAAAKAAATEGERATFLAQGTLYPDVIESASRGEQRTAHTIKTHHNVGGLPEDMQFQLIEPLRSLFKDEVRALGEALGLPEEIVWRHPFPGPGLAIRIIGEVTWGRLETLRHADAILLEELARGRPVSLRLASVRGAAAGPLGRRHGRRPHLCRHGSHPRGHYR